MYEQADVEMNDRADIYNTCRWYNRDLFIFNDSTFDKGLQHNLNNQPSEDTNNKQNNTKAFLYLYSRPPKLLEARILGTSRIG